MGSGISSRDVGIWGTLIVLTVGATACKGSISAIEGTPHGDHTQSPKEDSTTPAGGPQVREPELVDGRLQPRVYRLTGEHFVREMRVLFGAGTPNLGTLAVGSANNGFTNGAAGLMIDLATTNDVFEITGAYAAHIAQNAAQVVDCPGQTPGTRSCAESYLSAIARLAFRRPVTSEEQTDLLALYDLGAQDDYTTGIETAVHSILNSPNFLYRTEIGEGGGSTTLTQHEIATLLSFAIAGHSPDEALRMSAESGELGNASSRMAHAERLMASSDAVWRSFGSQWLDLTRLEGAMKNSMLYPEFDASLARAMRSESEAFVSNTVLSGGSFTDLFTSSEAWLEAAVAEVYGATHPGGGEQAVQLDPAQRAGILSRLAWLTSHARSADSSLERRGLYVWANLLCNDIPPPPDGVNDLIAELVGEDATKKEIVEARAEISSCNGCHQVMDPIGFAFENYGAIGEWRTETEGYAVEPAGSVPGFGDFADANELSALIAQSADAQKCFAERIAQFTMGASLGKTEEVEWLNEAHARFSRNGLTIRDIVLGLVAHQGFIERRGNP